MNVTAQLSKEHQFILKFIELMRRYVEIDNQQPDAQFLLQNTAHFIRFIQEFADHYHHTKEEQNLFAFLVEPGVLTHCNPVPQMLWEHQQARHFVQNIENALQSQQTSDVAKYLNLYAELLTEHIFKEDNILYPMAERGLTDAQKHALLATYAMTEQQLEGATLWERYDKLYRELEHAIT